MTRLAALGALTVHAYFVLAIQVHENHLALALPLLAIAATRDRRYWWLLLALSVIQALNLDLFYGLGAGVGYAIPRQMIGIDATVLLALVNCAALVMHASMTRAVYQSRIYDVGSSRSSSPWRRIRMYS